MICRLFLAVRARQHSENTVEVHEFIASKSQAHRNFIISNLKTVRTRSYPKATSCTTDLRGFWEIWHLKSDQKLKNIKIGTFETLGIKNFELIDDLKRLVFCEGSRGRECSRSASDRCEDYNLQMSYLRNMSSVEAPLRLEVFQVKLSNYHSDFTLFLCAFEANHPDCSSMFKSSLSAFNFFEFTKWHRMTANDVVGAVCTFEIFSWAAGAEVRLASSYCWGRSKTCCKRCDMICCVLFENKHASSRIYHD